MRTFVFHSLVLLRFATYPIFEGDKLSTGAFQMFVLIGIFGGVVAVLRSLNDIAKLLAAILNQMRRDDDE